MGRAQPPPRPNGSSLRAQCCHGSDVCSARLGFSSLVRICLPHAPIGSGAQSLKSWGFLAVFLFRGLHLPCSWSLIHFVREEGHDEREGEQAGLHPASARAWGQGPLCEAELHGCLLWCPGHQMWLLPGPDPWSTHFDPETAPCCLPRLGAPWPLSTAPYCCLCPQLRT